jgi:hypothetical protein
MIKSRRMRRAGYVARIGDRRVAQRGLVRKPEGKRSLGRPRCRWEDNIKMDLQEVGWGARTGLIWLRTGTGAERICECGNDPSGSIQCGEFDYLGIGRLLKKGKHVNTITLRRLSPRPQLTINLRH